MIVISVNSEESNQEALQTQLYSLINTNLQTKSFHTRQLHHLSVTTNWYLYIQFN